DNGAGIVASTTGYYWSSTSNATNQNKAISTNFSSSGVQNMNVNADRYTGLPIRPVLTKPAE
ncbi:MAG: hypothetical protein ACI39U_00735, partial [Candidatus Cryptobacteroides sp.]